LTEGRWYVRVQIELQGEKKMTNRLIQLLHSQQHRPIHPTGVRIASKKRIYAKASTRGNRNRRLIMLETKDGFMGPCSQKTRKPIELERQYHFTKGYRTRTA
jgi:hypothetical protein